MQNGINQDSGQKINRVLVVKLLRTSGLCSRADLARMSNLRPATITNIVNELKEMHLVREEGTFSAGRGRNGIAIALDKSYYKVIGIRLSRKYFLIGMFDLMGNELFSSEHSFEAGETPEEMFGKVQIRIQELMKQNIDGKVVAIGWAIPGPFFRKHGSEAIGTEYPDWTEIHIKEATERKFGIYTFLEHDANAGALAYKWKLGINSEKMLVYFSAGQGIGAGIVNGGNLVLGALGAAGEVGHMTVETKGVLCQCGNYGCLEKYCSSIALTSRINEQIATGHYSILEKDSTFREVSKAIKAGDKLAISEFNNVCDYLGVGVVNIVNILNPDIVVVGDELADVEPDIMHERVSRVVHERVNPMVCENMSIIVEKEKNDMALNGAAIAAIEELFKDPIAFNWVDIQ